MTSREDDGISRQEDVRSREDEITSRQDDIRNRHPVILDPDTAPYLCCKLSDSSFLLVLTNSRAMHDQQRPVVLIYSQG